jgi:LPPG:FO 2-phospho-L-lactate transferase
MNRDHVLYLSGGVGGARLAHGLHQLLSPEQLTFVVNTGDDLVHWGLHVSPDLDTMLYTLADVADESRGWGLSDETFRALEGVARFGGDDWFALGDRDLATHLMRTQWLRADHTLTEVTRRLCEGLGVRARILPMSDEPRATMIDTDLGTLDFQRWLVAHRGAPLVRKVWFRGQARITAEVRDALARATLIVIGPSNPYVSVDPILALDGVRERLRELPVIAVSPIVHGRAIKGPLASMLETLGQRPVHASSIAQHYGDLLDAFVVEEGDQVAGLPVLATQTIMHTRAESRRLAERLLEFARSLGQLA